MFAVVNHTLTRGGFVFGGGVDVLVIDRAWLPDVRVAGDSERGLLVGLSAGY